MIRKLAFRNLWRNRRRTLITVSSIGGGLMVSMLFTGLQDGNYAKFIDLAARTGSGHLTVENKTYRDDLDIKSSLSDIRPWFEILAQHPEVQYATARVSGQGVIASSHNSSAVTFDGIDPKEESLNSPVKDHIIQGSFFNDDPRGIIVGHGLAKKLKVENGSKVVLTTYNRENQTVQDLFRIAGVFDMGSEVIDSFYVQLPLAQIRKTLKMTDHEATQVAIFLGNYRDADRIQGELTAMSSGRVDGGVVRTWQEVMRDISNYIALDRGFNYILQFLAFMIIAAGILNTVLMSVLERQFEFGVMRAIGTTPALLSKLIVLETFLMGVLGVIGGSVFGWALNIYFKYFPLDLAMFTEEEISLHGVAMEPALRTGLYLDHYLVTIALILTLVVIVGLYPAFKAAHVVPVEALRDH